MPRALWHLLRTGKGPMDSSLAHAYDRGFQAGFRDTFRALGHGTFDAVLGTGSIIRA